MPRKRGSRFSILGEFGKWAVTLELNVFNAFPNRVGEQRRMFPNNHPSIVLPAFPRAHPKIPEMSGARHGRPEGPPKRLKEGMVVRRADGPMLM
jgi:hypothetical protein